MITAYPQFRESALEYGADYFLTKPIHPSDILEAVNIVLGTNSE